jgi:hypothetical protein
MLAVPTGLGSGGMRVHTTTGTGELYPLS